MMKTTPPVNFEENGIKYRITATYGIDYEFGRKHNHAPGFSLTCTIDRLSGRRWVDHGGGWSPKSITKHFPDLSPLIQWHLVSTEEPLHYLANAGYWMDFINGVYKVKPECNGNPLEAFKATIVWGAIPGDTDRELAKMVACDRAHMADMLRNRLPALMERFRSVMEYWGVME